MFSGSIEKTEISGGENKTAGVPHWNIQVCFATAASRNGLKIKVRCGNREEENMAVYNSRSQDCMTKELRQNRKIKSRFSFIMVLTDLCSVNFSVLKKWKSPIMK